MRFDLRSLAKVIARGLIVSREKEKRVLITEVWFFAADAVGA